MSDQPLSHVEKEKLVLAVGGPKAARDLIKGAKKVTDNFPVYIELTFGGASYMPKVQLVEKLLEKSFLKDAVTKQVLLDKGNAFTLTRHSFKLTEVTPAQLGFLDGAPWRDIVTAAASRGFGLCPQDTGVHLTLNTKGCCTESDSVIVASEPLIYAGVEYLLSIGFKRLQVVTGSQRHLYGPYQQILFRRN